MNIASVLNKDEEVIGTDYGYIMLPRNYDELGDPVCLIIVCHGAGAKLEDYKSNVVSEHSQTYWLDMGYAIMDMFACPVELANGSELHFGNPTVLECYKKGYEYVMEKYNLKSNEVLYIGDDINDIAAMELVDYRIAPKNLNPILPFKVNNLQITDNYGGNGAIREIADILVSME